MGDLEWPESVPKDIRVGIWHSFESWTFTTAEAILAASPGDMAAIYGGNAWFDRDAQEPMIRFSIPVFAHAAGAFPSDAEAAAAILGARLAAAAPGWPTREAHTVLTPVVEFRLTYETTPLPRRAAEPRHQCPPAGLMELIGASIVASLG